MLALAGVSALSPACSSPSTGNPESRSEVSGAPATSGTGALAGSIAGLAPGAGVCPADHPVICASGCCPAGSTCTTLDGGADGGACVTAPVTSCPADAPVQCAGGASCDGGSCSLRDQSSFHNDAQLRPPGTFADGRASGAIAFPQAWSAGCTVDAVSAPAAGQPASGAPFSLEAWVRTSGPTFQSATQTLIGFGNGTSSVALSLTASGISLGCAVPAAVLDGRWHLVAGVYQGGNATLYLDGVAKGTCASGALALPAGARVLIGNESPLCDPLFGALDEVRAVSSALSPTQAAADFAAAHLPLSPDTFGLWLFDDAAPARCCPAGRSCDASGACTASSSGTAACPAADPVACSNGGCCPSGTLCTASGCAKSGTAPACPASSPVTCGDGTCCPSGLSCSSGHCVASNGASTPISECGTGFTDVVTNGAHACCPNISGVTMIGLDSAYYNCLGNPKPICGAAGIPVSSCPAGTTKCTSSSPGGCISPATPAPCPGGASCSSNGQSLCCPNATDTCIGGSCCAPGTFRCQNGPACCPNQQCNAAGTACDVIAGPPVCGDGSPLCGGACCPSGTVCSGGACVASQPVGLFCANGTACGSVCCPSGTACLSPGQCGQPPEAPACGAGFSGACSAVGPCCKDGYACKGGSGSGGFSCVFTGGQVSRGGPQGPPCGTGFCASGQTCSGGVCCGADHPDACGGSCCLPGGGCAGAAGTCHCNAALPVACGAQCCADGMACDQGQCVAGCAAPPGAPTPACGTSCCAPGISCTNGSCACPGSHPVACGHSCCLPGAACASGACGCPADHAACGPVCCGEGQSCQNGSCGASATGSCDDGSGQTRARQTCPGGSTICCYVPEVCCVSGFDGTVGCLPRAYCR